MIELVQGLRAQEDENCKWGILRNEVSREDRGHTAYLYDVYRVDHQKAIGSLLFVALHEDKKKKKRSKT